MIQVYQVHLWDPLVHLRQVHLFHLEDRGNLVFQGHLGYLVYLLESSQKVQEVLVDLVVQDILCHSLQEVQVVPLVLVHLEDLGHHPCLQQLGYT